MEQQQQVDTSGSILISDHVIWTNTDDDEIN